MDTAALVLCAQQGDEDAFRRLVDAHYEVCWRYARRALAEPSDAEDVVQETFIRVYRGLASYQDRGQFRAWMFRILVNECRMANRTTTRRWRRFLSAEENGVDASVPESDVYEPDDELSSALAKLDPNQREAILLKFGEGLEYREIMKITGASESALKMRVKRGCAALRRMLESAMGPSYDG